jgi:hypothetical protein
MKDSTDDGFDQHYNVQVAVDQASLLIVAESLSNHPNDKGEAEPTLAALTPELGQVKAAALDNGHSVLRPATLVNNGALSRILRRVGQRIINRGRLLLPMPMCHRLPTPCPRSRWLINSRRSLATPSIGYANVR